MTAPRRLPFDVALHNTRQARGDGTLGGRVRAATPAAGGAGVRGRAAAGGGAGGAAGTGELLTVTAAAHQVASGGDLIAWTSALTQVGFAAWAVGTDAPVLPLTALYSVDLHLEWASYLLGGTVELLVDGAVVATAPGPSGLGREFTWSTVVAADAGDTFSVRVTQTSGSSQTIAARLALAAVEPLAQTAAADPFQAPALTAGDHLSGQTTNATDIAYFPGDLAVGELMLLFVNNIYASGAATTLGAWTLEAENGAVEGYNAVYSKVADAADVSAGQVTLDFTADEGWIGWSLVRIKKSATGQTPEVKAITLSLSQSQDANLTVDVTDATLLLVWSGTNSHAGVYGRDSQPVAGFTSVTTWNNSSAEWRGRVSYQDPIVSGGPHTLSLSSATTQGQAMRALVAIGGLTG